MLHQRQSVAHESYKRFHHAVLHVCASSAAHISVFVHCFATQMWDRRVKYINIQSALYYDVFLLLCRAGATLRTTHSNVCPITGTGTNPIRAAPRQKN